MGRPSGLGRTGFSGLKKKKRSCETITTWRDDARRILVIDGDDVISMGGTLIAWSTRITRSVAYMTSGNIAFSIIDAWRFTDLVVEFNRFCDRPGAYGSGQGAGAELFCATKRASQSDSRRPASRSRP